MELIRLEPEGQVKGASCKGGNLQSNKTRAKSKVSIASLEENSSPD